MSLLIKTVDRCEPTLIVEEKKEMFFVFFLILYVLDLQMQNV